MTNAVYLKNIRVASDFKVVSIDRILNAIKNETFLPKIAALPASDTKEYKTAKSKLPAWALNGVFEGSVTNAGFVSSNGFFHVDIDGLEDVSSTRAVLVASVPSLYALWQSPSGHGLKGLVKIPADSVKNDADFKRAFEQVAAYFASIGVVIDKSCKDVRRLCFVCSDKDIYINSAAPEFVFDLVRWSVAPKTKSVAKAQTATDKENVYITRACDLIYNSVAGDHHAARLRAGKLAGGFIANGLVNESAIVAALLAASDFICSQSGDSQDIVRKEQRAIMSGINSGRLQPVDPDHAPRHYPPLSVVPTSSPPASSNIPTTPVISCASFGVELDEAGIDVTKVIAIAQAIQLSQLHPAEIELLLKRAAKQIGVSIGSLKIKKIVTDSAGGDDFRAEKSDFLEELNEKHAVIPLNGRVYVVNRDFDPSLDRKYFSFSGKQDFLLMYMNRECWQHGAASNIGQAWLEHPLRRQYKGMCFMPNGDVDGYLNYFQGFGITPVAGKCDLFIDFMYEVICSKNDELFDYLWHWLAHLFQKPAELPGTAIVLRGAEGIGKNTFVECIGTLIGSAHFIQLSSIGQVVGRFGGHLVDKLLVFANEAIWGGDKTAEGTLKHMISDSNSTVEAKGKDIISVPNYKRLIAASNEDWVIPRGLNDRRWVVVDVSACRREDQDYFGNIKRELETGGYEALMDKFLSVDLSAFNPRSIPTKLKMEGWELKIRSGGSVLQWWFLLLERGYITKDKGFGDDDIHLWSDRMPKTDLHDMYLKYCEKMKISHPEMDCVMGKRLKEFGVGSARVRPSRINHYVFQNLEDSRLAFGAIVGIPVEYWSENEID